MNAMCESQLKIFWGTLGKKSHRTRFFGNMLIKILGKKVESPNLAASCRETEHFYNFFNPLYQEISLISVTSEPIKLWKITFELGKDMQNI